MHPESNLVDELHALDLWQTDPLLRARLAERSDPHVERDDDPADLARYGRLIGSAAAHDWAEQANRRAPELQGLDARGRRLERVDTHPHWQRLLASIRASGALARPQLQGDWLRPAVLFYLHGQVEAGSLCPATMTQAALPVLARHAPSLFEALQRAAAEHRARRCRPPAAAQARALAGHGHDREAGRLRPAQLHQHRHPHARPACTAGCSTASTGTNGSSARR
jgi:putative acyl-CoA dehydrogenase